MVAPIPSPEPDSSLLQQYLRELEVASRARDMERALAIGEEASRRGIEHPNLLGLAAQKHMRAGDSERAYPLLLRARELSPHNADILNDLGLCLVRLSRAREALSTLEAAIREKPDSARPHFNKALAHEQLGELDDERRELERVVAIEPRHHQALSLLAMLAADRNDYKATRDYAGRALALSPDEVPAKIALVSAEIGSRDFNAARLRLEALLRDTDLDADNRALAQTLMGDVLDGEGKFDEAFRCYAASAETQKTHYARAFGASGQESFRAQIERLQSYFSSAPAEIWNARKNDAQTPVHVFLMGFVRSGTTLLGQVLAGHSDIEVMHERDCLNEAVRDFIVPKDGLERLGALPDEALMPYRRSYWQKAYDWGYSAERKVFIDKSPLATSLLPLIARLFPDARILFVYRDPRDVVLSCFRRRFAMTEQKYHMLTLDGIAACYGSLMGFADFWREKFRLDVFDARHETLLANFESETARICDFLSVALDPAMKDFASRARVANIDIPNSADLARGLSRKSEGHWRNYRNELMPIMPALAPWCARFGYPEN